MDTLVGFDLNDDGAVVIEVDSRDAGVVPIGIEPGTVARRAERSLAESLDRVVAAATIAIRKLGEIPQHPDETQLTFGVKFSADLGAIIAKTTGEATFQVAVKWVRPTSR
ncbi:CU044_2847 family protein [Actinoplanes sp. Pm04-4]|uniref:CU044_2847 family protein n=1 Tax=Paractinoplanes pyxinae TaxID=2997416 RepID=A0ABT4B3B4_9ACTN|nr:CU044_2847 family protein [Actinoplanes pyxinae]MCY1140989.1 CU044_2847 family protein [Actinoplanes pyxinae]